MSEKYNGISRPHAWAMLIITYLVGVTAMLSQYNIAPIMKPLLESFGSSSLVDGGMLMTVFGIVIIIVSIPAGIIVMKIGLRKSTWITLVLIAIGTLIGAVTSGYSLMMVSRIVTAVGAAFAAIVGPAIISLLFPPQKRGIPMGLWTTWVGVAVFLSGRVAGLMTGMLGVKGMFWWVIVVTVVVLVLFIIIVRFPREIEGSSKGAKMSQAFSFRRTWLLALMFAVFSAVVAVYNTLAPTYVAETFGLSSTAAAAEASYFSLGMIIGGICFGSLFNFLKKRNAEVVGYIATQVIATVGFAMAFTVPAIGAISVVWFLVIGLCFSVFPTMTFSLCPTTVSKVIFASAAMALIMIGQKVGAAFGPTLGAMIVQNGGWGAMILPCIGCGVVLIILSVIYYVWNKNPTEAEKEANALTERLQAGGKEEDIAKTPAV